MLGLDRMVSHFFVVLLGLSVATIAFSGTVNDSDADGVPDAFDNCVDTPNGPLAGTVFATRRRMLTRTVSAIPVTAIWTKTALRTVSISP